MPKTFAVLVGACLATVPAAAADLVEERGLVARQAGSFAGARVRVPLGGGEEAGRVRAGLVAAPILRGQAMDGSVSMRFGEGLEVGSRPGRPLTLSMAGRPLGRPQPADGPGRRAGVSTLGWVAIGTAVVVVAGALWFVDAMNDSSE